MKAVILVILVLITPTLCLAEEEDIIKCVFDGNSNGIKYHDTLETSSDLMFVIKLKRKCKKAFEKVNTVFIKCKIHDYSFTATVTKESTHDETGRP